MNVYERIPKVELHLHLEGAIPHKALWDLIQKYGGDSTVPDIEALQRRFVYRDFPEFIEAWIWKNAFHREYEDFEFIAEAVSKDLAEQNIRYAEVFYSPVDYAKIGLNVQRLTEAIRNGIDRVPEIEIALITDFGRDYGAERAATTLSEVREVMSFGVIGIGLGGSEQKVPPELFAETYEKARGYGLRTTAHAGEAAGPESVWGAIRTLGVDRIGHGTRAGEDEALLVHLRETQIGIEMCPLSNVATNVVNSVEDHPVRRYFDRGLLVTINSDDPKMFHNSLAQEYQVLTDKLNFTPDEIRTIILNGIRASWMAPERKQEMIDSFIADDNWSSI